jgi:hypothetical protein|tara:strand:+ start:13264 stop:14490 length:1227 start_codon:yes stop_codon:yes gene_type:complete
MKKFSSFLIEDKNTHMEHLEDAVLNGGVNGTRQAINLLRSLRDMLSGNSSRGVSTTVKWDGAPAVFAGTDPSDGKFFVAKKGIFNKNPKVYKSAEEVDADTSGELATKLKDALKYLPELGITGVVQGDFLFSKADLKSEVHDGEKVTTFHPNTIVYSVPSKSELGATIRKAKIGIVWHTTYTGTAFENMKASFGNEIASKLNKTSNVWSVDAMFTDISGSATFTDKETKKLTSYLSETGKLFKKLDAATLNSISDDAELLQKVKTHFNTKVRDGQKVTNVKSHVKDLISYINKYYEKESGKRKSDKGKQKVTAKRDDVLKFFSAPNVRNLENIFTMMNLLIDAKEMVISKMDQASNITTLLRTKDGFQVTAPEGYVAIDTDGSALKLVNRMQFSHANFSSDYIKGWEK